ncbi:MAG: response regulator [Candidatus Omnitrophota bacterium]|jgi:serine phosphatase RsbU (regulator of sigma subunit)/FixJ family two-component response regulator|nr:MAG: response regulator [Candidatus Omnitrophota bacterium]
MTEKEIRAPYHFIDRGDIPERRHALLLCSDDADVISEISRLLQESELRLDIHHAVDVVRQIESRSYIDMVLLDLRLAGETVGSICSQLKNHAKTRDIPILLLARKDEIDLLKSALRFGADDFINVPIFPQEFLVRMRSLLGTHAWQRQAQKSRERVMILSKIVFGMNMGLTLAETVVPSLVDIARHVDADLAFVILFDSNGMESDRIMPEGRKDAEQITISPLLLEKTRKTGMPQMEVAAADNAKVQQLYETSQTIVLVPIAERKRTLAMLGVTRTHALPFFENEVLSLSLISDILAISISRSLHLQEIARAHLVVKREFQMMGRLQKLLLPQSLPSMSGVQFRAFYQPAMETGGDYYDIIPLTNDDYAVVVADVSGHGAPAAMNMGIARSILHTVSLSQNISPSGTLYFLNKLLCRLLGEDAHITMFYTVLNIKEMKLTWSNAGHVPCIIHRAGTGELELIGDPSDGPPLGWWNTAEFEEKSTFLQRNDLVFLFTDGVIEAVNLQKEQFGMERLRRELASSNPLHLESVAESVVHAIQTYIGEMPLQDDLTLLAFQRITE